jgi:hypothetical protein
MNGSSLKDWNRTASIHRTFEHTPVIMYDGTRLSNCGAELSGW